MADSDPLDPERAPDFRSQGEQLGLGFTEPANLSRLGRLLLSFAQEYLVWVVEWALKHGGRAVVYLASTLTKGEDAADPVFRELARTAVKDLTGADLRSGHAAIGKQLLEALTGGPGAAPNGRLEPSAAGAEAYMTMVMQLALEGYLEGAIVQSLSLGYLEKFGELDDILANVLSINRITRRVVNPLLQARVVTPMQWLVNKQYRPELLSPGELARQVARGRVTREAALEEMARQGWSDERAEALLSNAAKFFSTADAYLSWRMGMWSREQAAQHLRDQGYTLEQADHALQLQTARDVASFEESLATAAVTAYADRRISRAEFGELVRSSLHDQQTAARLLELGEARRALNVRHLSPAEARRLAKAGIGAHADYRRALERDGYTPEAIAMLDLELRTEISADRALEELRAEQEAERAAERERRAAEKAARDQELAEKRSRAYGSLAEARRLYVRGFVGLDRYRAALEAERLPNLDIDAYLADAETERAEYLEALERKRQADARDTGAVVPIAAIEQAVIRGILFLDDYDRELEARRYDTDERRILVQLLADRLEERRRAAAEREAAAARAEVAGISLASWERAVRLGVRTRAQYAAFLAQIGTADTARALILDLLDAQLRIDAEAQAKRDEAAARAARRGVSLEQRWRAVVRGIAELEYYAAALRDTGIATEDQAVLLEMLEAEALAAAEARARREELAGAEDGAELPLSVIERAVKLGILDPEDLRDRARARGYREEDLELLVSLVVADIPDVRAGQARERTIAGELRERGLSLSQQKDLVTRGIQSLEAYEAWLAEQGYTADDAALLRQLLEEETAADLDGLRRRLAAALEKADGAPALEEIAAALRAGELDVPQFVEVLASWGAGRDEALVFGRLLLLLDR